MNIVVDFILTHFSRVFKLWVYIRSI